MTKNKMITYIKNCYILNYKCKPSFIQRRLALKNKIELEALYKECLASEVRHAKTMFLLGEALLKKNMKG